MRAGRLGAGGRSLEWAIWGEGPPRIVLLHEGLGSVGLWRGFPEALAGRTGLAVLAYSRAGHGRSDPAELPRPLDYMTREAGVLGEVLEAAGFEEGWIAGHSDGATIAAIHAGTDPHPGLRGAVLMAPHFFTEEMGLASIAGARARFEAELRGRMARHHDDAEATFRGWSDAWLDPGFRDWDVGHVIPRIRVPVLAVQGREDPYGTLAQIDALDAATGPVSKLVLEGCGHAPHLERPAETLEAVADFCR